MSESLVPFVYLCEHPGAKPHCFVVDSLQSVPGAFCPDVECPDYLSSAQPVGRVGSEEDLEVRRRLQIRPSDA